jgi:hypothetical protein
MRYVPGISSLIASVCLFGLAQADNQAGALGQHTFRHHKKNDHPSIAKENGYHHLHETREGHNAHAHVQNNQIKKIKMERKNSTLRGSKKVKHHGNNLPAGASYSGALSIDNMSALTNTGSEQQIWWVGWAFKVAPNTWVVFWFQVSQVIDGTQGASDFASVNWNNVNQDEE